jgi:general secretion pathway protein G
MQSKQKLMRGITVIQAMIVVFLLGLIATLLVPRLLTGSNDQTRVQTAQKQIIRIQKALDAFKEDNGFYPTETQGLQALSSPRVSPPYPDNWREGGYLPKPPLDPWGQNFQYQNPGKHHPNGVDVFTTVPNSTNSQTGQAKIIGNWNIKR